MLSAEQYWKLRALSEQQRREQAEATVALLQKQQEAAKTGWRLEQMVQQLKAEGVVDLTDGDWRPDDASAQFVRMEQT